MSNIEHPMGSSQELVIQLTTQICSRAEYHPYDSCGESTHYTDFECFHVKFAMNRPDDQSRNIYDEMKPPKMNAKNATPETHHVIQCCSPIL